MPIPSRKMPHRGFTVMEVLAAALLGVVVTAVSLPFTNRLFTSQAVKEQLTATAAVLQKVRVLRSMTFEEVFQANRTFENHRTKALPNARGILKVEPSRLDPQNIAEITVTVVWTGRGNTPREATLATFITRAGCEDQ